MTNLPLLSIEIKATQNGETQPQPEEKKPEKQISEEETKTPTSTLQRQSSSQKPKISIEDFNKIALLGRGSYGEVWLVKKIDTGKSYALKAIDKNFMKKVRFKV